LSENKTNAILIAPNDDVVTAIVELKPGEAGRYAESGKLREITVVDEVPKFHKIALRDIARGGQVRKYGEIIGVATQNIAKGSHVSDKNIASPDELPGRA